VGALPLVVVAAALFAVVVAGPAAAAAAHARGPLRTIRYAGVTLRVPAGWPVYRLARVPGTCVRFNRHAVYLGTPSANQSCPVRALGHTEAILVDPVGATVAAAAAADGAGGSARGPAVSPLPTVSRGESASVTLRVPGRAVVVASWGRARTTVAQALAADPRTRAAWRRAAAAGFDQSPSAATAGPGTTAAGPATRATTNATAGAANATAGVAARTAAAASATAGAGPATSSRAHAAVTGSVFTGLGFDACTAPSTTAMASWAASPYRAVGIYIGGANMGCSQPNLTNVWTTAQTNAGWHLIPTYVGLQAPGNSCGCASIQSGQAIAEGKAAAQDAIAHAQLLGIGPGNPIYDDMEAYTTGGTTSRLVLNYLSAWTQTLHAAGYQSGVYSSSNSGIRDLATSASTIAKPDDLWIASWNGSQSTSDPNVPATAWAAHQRLHQYEGGHTESYGSARISVDSDYLDGATAGAAPLFADGTYVQLGTTAEVFRIAGEAPMLVQDWSAVGGVQPYTSITPQQYAELATTPLDGTFLTTISGQIYRVAGGAALPVSSWNLYGGPQTSVEIDAWNIANAGQPLSHLNVQPVNGTIVEGLPSGTYWIFENGERQATSANPAAIQVDDEALAAYTVYVPPPPKPKPKPVVMCTVPSIRHLTLSRASQALKRAHCSLGKVRRMHHTRKPMHVVGQNPRAHRKVRGGTRVNVSLW
jgi:hypothetical protein